MTFGRSFPAALRLPWGMFTHLDHSRLLRFAGLFPWAAVGLPLLLLSLPVEQGAALVVAAALGWQACLAWASFGFGYAGLNRALGERRAVAHAHPMLFSLTVSAPRQT